MRGVGWGVRGAHAHTDGSTEALVQEAAKHFANVKISNVSREIVDDDIVF